MGSGHEVQLASGSRVDGRWDDTLIEVKSEVHGLRNLHAALMRMALVVAAEPSSRGLLVLIEPRIASARLRREMERVRAVLSVDVGDRLDLAIARGGRIDGLPKGLSRDGGTWLQDLVARSLRHRDVRLRRPSSSDVILELLVNRWLVSVGPVTTAWLVSVSGCSYPTVARALDRLDDVLVRSTDRRVELGRFPRDAWARLLARSDEFRATMRFVDSSGQARSPTDLLERLGRLHQINVAVGGVFGALHHLPALDVVGSPRLDVSLHCPDRIADTGFVQELDPALRPSTGQTDRPPSLVVHCMQRGASLFEPGRDGTVWADPAECLLDLHDARLEAQADEFVRSFEARRRGAGGRST